jgi:hypothetical protein
MAESREQRAERRDSGVTVGEGLLEVDFGRGDRSQARGDDKLHNLRRGEKCGQETQEWQRCTGVGQLL